MTPNSRRPAPLRWIIALLLTAASLQATLALSGCGAKSDQSAATTTTTTTSTATTTPPAPDSLADATPASAELELGAKIFKDRCMLCHGASGHGDGTASKALKPPPRNFHDQAYMSSRTDAQLLETIHNGKGAMPAWGKTGVLKENEMRAALAYIRTFADKP